MKENILIYYAIIPLSVGSFLIGVFNLFSVPAIPEYVIWLTVPLFIALFYFAYVLNNHFKLSVKLKKNFYMRRVLVCIAIGFFVFVKEKKGGLIPEEFILLLLAGYALVTLLDANDAIRMTKKQ